MRVTLGLAGDTMLGRGVAETIRRDGPGALFAPEVEQIAHEADLFLVNLECCISERGAPWPDPRKPFFFRAPPEAVDALATLGVDCVTVANNHALDYGAEALLDTFDHLGRAGIRVVGAGPDEASARSPMVLTSGDASVAVVGLTDHPPDFAAAPSSPGVAFADLRRELPTWVTGTLRSVSADVVVVTPHWGPNMVTAPAAHVQRVAPALVDAGATLVAGHSAHVFHGVDPPVLFDLGDFIDDYAVDPRLRNDLGVLWLVTFENGRPIRTDAVPLALDYCHTRLAGTDESAWIGRRLTESCRPFGVTVIPEGDRFVLRPGESGRD